MGVRVSALISTLYIPSYLFNLPLTSRIPTSGSLDLYKAADDTILRMYIWEMNTQENMLL